VALVQQVAMEQVHLEEMVGQDLLLLYPVLEFIILVVVAAVLILHQAQEPLELVGLVLVEMVQMSQLMLVKMGFKTLGQAEEVVHQMAQRQVLAQAAQA